MKIEIIKTNRSKNRRFPKRRKIEDDVTRRDSGMSVAIIVEGNEEEDKKTSKKKSKKKEENRTRKREGTSGRLGYELGFAPNAVVRRQIAKTLSPFLLPSTNSKTVFSPT